MTIIIDNLNHWINTFLENKTKPSDFLSEFANNIDYTYESLDRFLFEINDENYLHGQLSMERESIPNHLASLTFSIKPEAGLTGNQLQDHWGKFKILPKSRANSTTELVFNQFPKQNRHNFSAIIIANRLDSHYELSPNIIEVTIQRISL